MSFLAFILPPVFYLRVFRRDLQCRNRIFPIFIAVFGIVGMTIATYVALLDISLFFTGKTASC